MQIDFNLPKKYSAKLPKILICKIFFHRIFYYTVYGGNNDTSRCHLAVFSINIAFYTILLLPTHPPQTYPVKVLVVLATPMKNNLKYWEI